MNVFDYTAAFRRNLGLFSAEEQNILRRSRVAILGLGGLGGINALMLARMGVGRFLLADFDTFSLANINRQSGAMMSTLGRPKTEVIAGMIRDINPEAEIRSFEKGARRSNIESIIRDADLVVDSVDLFAVPARELIYREASRQGRPVIAALPLGFGGAVHVFTGRGRSFDDYFALRPEMSYFEKLIALYLALCPHSPHLAYYDLAQVSLNDRTGPSLSSACHLGAGILGMEAATILLNRRPQDTAHRHVVFDPYVGRHLRGRLRWGNRGPIQRIKRWWLARRCRHLEAPAPESVTLED